MSLFYEIVLYFVFFSVCGWVVESVFCSILEKKPVNRGFLTGPVCPVYGFGGLAIVYLLAPVRENPPLLFLLGAVCCTVLEYAVSVLLEKLFDTKWWDYSNLPFHLNGRICLQFSIFFGVLSLAGVHLLYPPFHSFMERIAPSTRAPLAVAMLFLIGADTLLSVRSVLQLNGKLAELQRLMNELKAKLAGVSVGDLSFGELLEKYRADHSEGFAALRQSIESSLRRFEQLRARPRLQQRRILKAFPRMNSLSYPESMLRLRESLGSLTHKMKKTGGKK